MALISICLLAFLGVIGAVISTLLADEFKNWTPRLVELLIQRAIRSLPADQRARYDEEWRSHANDLPGHVAKIIVALGFLRAARRIAPPSAPRFLRTFASDKRYGRFLLCYLGGAFANFIGGLILIFGVGIPPLGVMGVFWLGVHSLLSLLFLLVACTRRYGRVSLPLLSHTVADLTFQFFPGRIRKFLSQVVPRARDR